jgi:hypothetical protein
METRWRNMCPRFPVCNPNRRRIRLRPATCTRAGTQIRTWFLLRLEKNHPEDAEEQSRNAEKTLLFSASSLFVSASSAGSILT